jgi:hypothetical protein
MAADKCVIDATRELDQLADEDVLLVPVSHVVEYEQVLKRFYALPNLSIPERREVSQTLNNHSCGPQIDEIAQPINEGEYLVPTNSKVCSSEISWTMILTRRK